MTDTGAESGRARESLVQSDKPETTVSLEQLRAALDWAVNAGLLVRTAELYGLPEWFKGGAFVAPKVLANRLAQRRFRERMQAGDPARWEAFKRKERRRQRLNYQQNSAYAERKRSLQKTRYASEPDFRARSAARNATNEAKQRRRALSCLSKGSLKHLPDQLKIIQERASRLLKEISET